MGVVIPRKTLETLSQAKDPRKAILEAVGDLKGVEVLYNMVLVAVYIRPERTIGGIIRPSDNVAEDIWQGKSGLVIKLGPSAFESDEQTDFHGQRISVGEWCAFRIGDAWQLSINQVPCRLVQDSHIKLRLTDPGVVF